MCKGCRTRKRNHPGRPSKHSPGELFWAKVCKTEGCWLWTANVGKDGYGKFQVSVLGENRQITWRAHVWAFTEANGPVPSGKYVLHSCNEPLCVRPEHLRVGTQSENMRQAYAEGRCSSTALTPAKVAELRQLASDGFTALELAQHFKIKRCSVYAVLSGRHWNWVTNGA